MACYDLRESFPQVVYFDDDEDAEGELSDSDSEDGADGWETDDDPEFSKQDSIEDDE